MLHAGACCAPEQLWPDMRPQVYPNDSRCGLTAVDWPANPATSPACPWQLANCQSSGHCTLLYNMHDSCRPARMCQGPVSLGAQLLQAYVDLTW